MLVEHIKLTDVAKGDIMKIIKSLSIALGLIVLIGNISFANEVNFPRENQESISVSMAEEMIVGEWLLIGGFDTREEDSYSTQPSTHPTRVVTFHSDNTGTHRDSGGMRGDDYFAEYSTTWNINKLEANELIVDMSILVEGEEHVISGVELVFYQDYLILILEDEVSPNSAVYQRLD